MRTSATRRPPSIAMQVATGLVLAPGPRFTGSVDLPGFDLRIDAGVYASHASTDWAAVPRHVGRAARPGDRAGAARGLPRERGSGARHLRPQDGARARDLARRAVPSRGPGPPPGRRARRRAARGRARRARRPPARRAGRRGGRRPLLDPRAERRGRRAPARIPRAGATRRPHGGRPTPALEDAASGGPRHGRLTRQSGRRLAAAVPPRPRGRRCALAPRRSPAAAGGRGASTWAAFGGSGRRDRRRGARQTASPATAQQRRASAIRSAAASVETPSESARA